MEQNQAQQVLSLGKKLRKEKRSKSSIIASLKSAGILDKNNAISKNYPTLKSAISSLKGS